jgi:hypothetical protein
MKHVWLVAVLLGSTACANGEAGNGEGDPLEAGPALDGSAPDTSNSSHPPPPTEAGPPGDDASSPDSSGADSSGVDSSGGPEDTGAPADVTVPADDSGRGPADAPSEGDAPSSHDAPSGQDAPASTNLAPTGTGYTWQSMTSASADTGKKAAPAVNDGNASTDADIDSSSGDSANAWEGAGVVFASAHAMASVTFVQGKTVAGGDGWFEANLKLQFSTDGTTWTDSGWSSAPTYSYSSAVSGKSFVFSGAQASGIKGVRVVGQVNTTGNSWWAAVGEVEVFGF